MKERMTMNTLLKARIDIKFTLVVSSLSQVESVVGVLTLYVREKQFRQTLLGFVWFLCLFQATSLNQAGFKLQNS